MLVQPHVNHTPAASNTHLLLAVRCFCSALLGRSGVFLLLLLTGTCDVRSGVLRFNRDDCCDAADVTLLPLAVLDDGACVRLASADADLVPVRLATPLLAGFVVLSCCFREADEGLSAVGASTLLDDSRAANNTPKNHFAVSYFK